MTIQIALFVCHWLADYTHLSTPWMLSAKRLGKPFYPIFIHALVHACLMLVTLAAFGLSGLPLAGLFLFQLLSHFLIDVWKGRMNHWFPSLQSPSNKWHWVVFGFDQLMHTVVIILMSAFANNQLNA